MLRELYVENVAVIEKTAITFSKGFNVLTGETGAGKSILIHALGAILGERTNREMVRSGAHKAAVTASFTDLSEGMRRWLQELGYPQEEGEDLIISREIAADGRSTCRISGRPANVSTLREVGNQLINIHGQHDNQALLSPDTHIHFIDRYGELEDLLSAYAKTYANYTGTRASLEAATMDESEKARRMDMLTFQIEEIENAQLSQEEENELVMELGAIRNATQIVESLGAAHAALYGDSDPMNQPGGVELLGAAADNLEEIQEYLEGLEDLAGRFREIFYEAEELAKEVSAQLAGFDFDPSRLDEIEDRLNEIYKLKRKYGVDIEEVLNFLEKAKEELEAIESGEERMRRLERECEAYRAQAEELAGQLSQARLAAADRFVRQVGNELAFLDMPNVTMTYDHRQTEMHAGGIDNIQFLISTNLGEEPKSLSRIASGGELSRIMLSIKNVLADKDDIATLIFDEVDTGVSGRAAQKIGQKLREASRGRQIICVTHLAQIGALADTHMLIQKSAKNDKTYTHVEVLDRDGRRNELARILGGENVTPLTLEHADEMLTLAGN